VEDLKDDNKGLGISLKELLMQKGIGRSDFEAVHKQIEELTSQKEKLEKDNNRLNQEIEIHKSKNEDKEEPRLSVDSLFNKAVNALKQENHVDAMGFLQAVLILEPENIKAMNNLALVYFELGYENRAVETLDKILAKEPENKTALKNMAVVLEEFTVKKPKPIFPQQRKPG